MKYFAALSLTPLLGFFLITFCNSKRDTTNNQLTSKSPNIIFILADDMGYWELGSYGQKDIKTPILIKKL